MPGLHWLASEQPPQRPFKQRPNGQKASASVVQGKPTAGGRFGFGDAAGGVAGVGAVGAAAGGAGVVG
jgi:hypothetical protein